MDITFKGRRTGVQERFRAHAEAKLSRIVKLDQKAIRIDVEVTQERNPRQSNRRERVELTITSRGPVIRAEAAADDRFVALDRALAKLESRLRRACDRRKGRNSGHSLTTADLGGAPPGEGDLTLAVPPPPEVIEPELAEPERRVMTPAPNGRPDDRTPVPAPRRDGVVPIAMEGDGPLVVREKYHEAAPMTIDRALLEMELVGHDFFLFRDTGCNLASVVYRRRGYNYGVIRLVEEFSAPYVQLASGQLRDGRTGGRTGGR
ncbi:MAG TPA: ribosome-associated translation inhibitor RaiA [Streptosporangiaceae bacterium]|nr:ribosome-associated translation inhibitor RaiA [Streptosporangiaceae bacterium]